MRNITRHLFICRNVKPIIYNTFDTIEFLKNFSKLLLGEEPQ